ncbi:MAG: YczE/YyaS/YitT family protein, partial [Aeromicrobium sp.]
MFARLSRLVIGLMLYGFTMALMVQAGLGLDPWDVFHQGLTHLVPLTFGQVVIAVGALVLLLWIPLRQRPGIGTVLNVVLIGLAADAGIALVPAPDALWARIALLLAAIIGNGLAGALYIGARLGPGPRDGLWVAIVDRTDLSVRMVRTGIEVSVLVAGFLLGGTVGIGTVLYALAIGPLVQLFLELLPTRSSARVERARTPKAHVRSGVFGRPDPFDHRQPARLRSRSARATAGRTRGWWEAGRRGAMAKP